MARKKNDADVFLGMLGLLGFLILGLFLINSVCVVRHYDHKYKFNEATARVTDTWNFARFLPEIVAAGAVAFFACAPLFAPLEEAWNAGGARFALTASYALIVVGVFMFAPFLPLSARLATTQAGLLIYEQRGYFVIPADWNCRSFSENIFRLKIVDWLFEMERLELRDVTKITREGGKVAFVHGRFGTRKISWRDKQKRDEYVAALENACGKRLGSYF